MQPLPLFPVTGVGSLPRTQIVLRALRQKHKAALTRAEFDLVANQAVLDALKLQDDAGLDIDRKSVV